VVIFRSIAVASCALLASCANLYPPSSKSQIDDKQSYWMSYDASRRGTLVLAEGSKTRSCSEPAPDVGLSFVNSVKGDLTTPGGTSVTGLDAAANATVVALAGRNDVVLLAREALFRICEASLNGTIRPGDVRPLFITVFEQVTKIAEASADESKSKANFAETQLKMLAPKK